MSKSCPNCGSTKSISKGKRVRKTDNVVYQRRVCVDCSTAYQEILEGVTPDEVASTPDDAKTVREVKYNSVYQTFGMREFVPNARKFVITSAQNDTDTNYDFLRALELYCETNEAELVIIPIRYVNPSIYERTADQTWDSLLVKYLCDSRFEIGENIQVLADLKIVATMQSPLSSVDALTRGKTTIIGHSQVQLKSIHRAKGSVPVLATTTGSVSHKAYSDSRVGYIADFNHSFSAVVVELEDDNETFHIRHLIGDSDNGFFDLGFYYTKDDWFFVGAEAIVCGDEHVGFTSPDVYKATFEGEDCLVNSLIPDFLVRHDIFDARSISHHDEQSFFKKVEKNSTDSDDLLKELTATANYLIDTTPENCTSIVVSSNHDRHLDRWLDNPKSALDVKNSFVYTSLRKMKLDAIANGEYADPFVLWMKEYMKLRGVSDKFIFLKEDESFIIQDIEVGQHGDRGANGARGSLLAFSKLGVKTVTGHSHVCGIEKGAYSVGTSTIMDLSYNKGLTSWTNTQCIIYSNGKRQLINIIDGKFSC